MEWEGGKRGRGALVKGRGGAFAMGRLKVGVKSTNGLGVRKTTFCRTHRATSTCDNSAKQRGPRGLTCVHG